MQDITLEIVKEIVPIVVSMAVQCLCQNKNKKK